MSASPFATPRASISGPAGLGQPSRSPRASISGPSSPVAAQYPANGQTQPKPLKPIGIVNEQNTCFLNSTFQALSATAPLISLLINSPSSSIHPKSTAILPPPAISPSRIPALLPSALEPPLCALLPVTRAFINSLLIAWKKKDGGGGTSGPSETNSSRSMTLRSLLREIARKYDQYDDYRQQDAHELLRHLLDSMEMEEKDMIKRVQPQPPVERKRRKSAKAELAAISPMVSPLPSPANSHSSSQDPMHEAVKGGMAVPEQERLVPFVDVLFGGSFASVVVCERCKSVSHTYEGFLDISLSLKGDDPRPRKRDRIKALFRSKPPPPSKQSSAESRSHLSPSVTLSDTELSDNERPQAKERERRRSSFDHDDRPTEGLLHRNSSLKALGGLKPSFGFRRKGSRSGSAGSTSGTSTSTAMAEPERLSAPPHPPSPSGSQKSHASTVGPTPAQTAYIQRILAGSTLDPVDPLAKVRAAQGSPEEPSASGPPEFGLLDSLRAFTSVEVLEGDNAFACKKCWKIKSGKYQDAHPPLREEDEEGVDALERSPDLHASRAAPPSISVMSDTLSDGRVSPLDDRSSLGRSASLSSSTSGTTSRSSRMRAPSPLRRQLPTGEEADAVMLDSPATSLTAVGTNGGDPESDGLSDTSSEDDEPPKPSELPVGRPRMPPRRKSTHFVMRRAFKRYLIAKEPEVLVFHFKRFKQTNKSGLTFTTFYDLKKMTDFLSFPETMDLAPFLAPNRNDYKVVPTPSGPRAPYMEWASPEQGPELEPVMYRLYAVVVHLGTMIGGHYIAYTLVDPERMFDQGQEMVESMASLDVADGVSPIPRRSRPPGEDRRVWCFCSDTSIRLASVDEVLRASAYLCFYEKM